MSATRACGNVPPATSSLFLALVRLQSSHIIWICRPTVFLHLHQDIMHNTPTSKHVMMTLIHAQLGDVKHQAEVSQGRHFPGAFFWERVKCQRQAQGVGLHRAAVGLKVREESCSDVCVCIPTRETSSEGNTRLISVVWQIYFCQNIK